MPIENGTPPDPDAVPRIRIMLVDDHPMVRRGLRFFLSTCPDLEVVAEATNGIEAVELCGRAKPDVVLMDMVMPGMDGVAATRLIRERCPETQVVALTSFVDEDKVKGVLEAGAVGYMLKDTSEDRLADAVREAHRGRGVIDASAAKTLLPRPPQEPDPLAALTSREREVLVLLSEGLTNQEIATRLFLSIATVRLHVSHILKKLEAPNRTTAARLAVKHGLVPGDSG
jgi:two-component system, NarL family, response regulator LiaR